MDKKRKYPKIKVDPVRMLNHYREKWIKSGRSFISARRIWLYCVKNKIEVPQDVLDVFTATIQNDHDDYQESLSDSIKSANTKWDEDLDLYTFISVFLEKHGEHKRGVKTKAYEDCAAYMEKKTGDQWNVDKVKTRYFRYLKEIE